MSRLQLSDLARNAMLEGPGLVPLLNDGKLCLYTSNRTDARLLATLRFAGHAFTVKDGEAKARPMAADQDVIRDGKATWFRALTRKGELVLEGAVGGDLTLDRDDIRPGSRVGVDSLVLRLGE